LDILWLKKSPEIFLFDKAGFLYKNSF